jgi:hypothetical protein
MIKSLIIPVLALISLFAFNQGFTQVSSTNSSTPAAATYEYEKPEVEGVGISVESGNTNQTGNNEQYKEEGNTYNQKRENTRPTIYKEGNNTKTDNDGDTNKYLNYDIGNTKFEKETYKQDNGLHKGWYKKGKHKGR